MDEPEGGVSNARVVEVEVCQLRKHGEKGFKRRAAKSKAFM